jgi:hypothetical protein
MGGRAGHPWLHGGHLERQHAQDGLAMTRRHAGDSKRFLVLFVWRHKLGLCLNYLLQSPAWFEENLNHLGAGAFEITSSNVPIYKSAGAMPKTLFDMGFFMADGGLDFPPFLLKIEALINICTLRFLQ